MPSKRVHLPSLTDEEVFAYAAEACSRFRRFAAYGMLLYVPMSAMALTLVNPPTAAAAWMGTGTDVLGVVLVLASVNLVPHLRIFDEAAARLERDPDGRDPDGTGQRAWLGYPNPG